MEEILYNPNDLKDAVYWVRLMDSSLVDDGIEDIPVSGQATKQEIVDWWVEGDGRCDCIRTLAFYQVRNTVVHEKCGTTKMQLLGIWDREGSLIYHAE